MYWPVVAAGLLTLAPAHATEARLVIADGAKTAAEATSKLVKLALPSSVRLAPGYPRVVASDSIKGLNPGLHIVILGFCPAEDRIRVKTGEKAGTEDVRAYLQLRHHAYLLKQLKKSASGVYSKQVTTDAAFDCPVLLFKEPPASSQELAAAWKALQRAPESAGAWVTFGNRLEAEMDLDGADYAYSVALERDPASEPAQQALYKLDFVGARGR